MMDVRHQSNFGQAWATACAKRAVRDYAISPLDKMITLPAGVKNPFIKVGQVDINLSESARRYDQLINLDTLKVTVGQSGEFKHSGNVFFSKAGRTAIKETVADNFGHLKLVNDMSCKSLLRDTVVGVNLKSVAWPAAKGLIFTTLARLTAMGLSLWTVAVKTQSNYHQTHSLWCAAKTFSVEAVKSLVSWEVGSMGYILGVAALPVGILTPIAGIACMGLASVGTKAVLDELV